MTGQPPSTPGASSKRAGASLAVPYAISTVVGALPVFLSTKLVLFPLLVMAFYLAFGLRVAEKQGYVLEFADSFYYLGFTLTIASLLASLDPLHPDAKPDPKIVLHFFGLGMFTTLFGVTGRTVLQMFYRTPDESIEATNRRIAVAAQDFLLRLQELVSRADEALAGTLHALDVHMRRRADEAGASLDEIVSQLGRTATELKEFRIDGSQIDASLREASQVIGDASRRAAESLTAAGQASERLVQISQSASEATRSGAEAIGRVVAQLGSHVEGAASAADAVSTQLDRIAGAPQRLDKSVEAVIQVFESLANRLGEHLGATASGAALVVASLGDLNRQVSGLSIGNLRNEFVNLEGSLASLRRTLEGDGRKPDAQVLGDLAVALEQALAGAKRLNAVLDEIVEAVELKLDRIQ